MIDSIKKRIILASLILFIVVINIIFYAVFNLIQQGENVTNYEDTNELEVLSHSIRTLTLGSWEAKRVEGDIKNIGDRNIDKATITVKFYDSYDILLNTEKDYVFNLDVEKTDHFVVSYDNSDPYYDQYDRYTISVFVYQNNIDSLIHLFSIIGILSISVILFVIYISRNRTIEINFNDKDEFLNEIDICLVLRGYHLDFKTENTINYRRGRFRVTINFEFNKAIITGPMIILGEINKLYGKENV